MEELLGAERPIAVARELTKAYEEIRRGSIREVAAYFREHEPRGEFTLVLAGKQPEAPTADMEQIAREVQQLIANGMDKKEAFKTKAREYGIRKSEIYNYYLKYHDQFKD